MTREDSSIAAVRLVRISNPFCAPVAQLDYRNVNKSVTDIGSLNTEFFPTERHPEMAKRYSVSWKPCALPPYSMATTAQDFPIAARMNLCIGRSFERERASVTA